MIHLYEYVYFLTETRITQQQLLFLMFLYKKDQEAEEMYKKAFPVDDGTLIGQMWIKDLERHNYIKIVDNKYEVTEKFRKYFINKAKAYDELVNAYPAFFTNENNVKIPLVTGDRYEYMSKYGIAIADSDTYHLKVLNLLNYGIKNNLIKMGLSKFIDSQYWIQIEKVKKEQDNNFNNSNFDFEKDF